MKDSTWTEEFVTGASRFTETATKAESCERIAVAPLYFYDITKRRIPNRRSIAHESLRQESCGSGKALKMYLRRFILIACVLTLHLAFSIGGYAANSPPTATPDSYTINEDTTLTVSSPGVLANDSDPDGNSITAVGWTSPTNGTLSPSSNGSFTYKPNTNFNGIDGFTYRAKDASSTSAPVNVTITINPTNDAPRATNDSFSIGSDTTLVVNSPGVLANDFDVDGSPITAVLVTNVTRGALALNADGSFTYAPFSGYRGNDFFTYAAFDSLSMSVPATVVITVGTPVECSIDGPGSVCANSGGSIFSAPPSMMGYAWSITGRGTIAGSTNGSNVTINATSSGTFTLSLAFTNGSAITNCSRVVAVLARPAAAVIGSQTSCAGETVLIQAALTGVAPWTLAWSDGFVQENISTNVASRIVAPLSNTTYTVTNVLDGICSGTGSGNAVITVNGRPVVTLSPTDRTVCPGTTVTFSSVAIGNPAPGVRWQVSTNGGMTWTNLWPIVDATQTNYSFTAAKADDGKYYRARFTNECGMVTNVPVLLRVGTTAKPLADHDVCPGNDVTFSTTASGFGPFKFQWRKNNAAMAGATNSVLTLTNVGAGSTGIYSVVVTGACNVVTQSARLALSTSVSGTPLPHLVRFVGSIAIFDGRGITAGPFTYQWSKGGTILASQTNSTLMLSNLTTDDSGNYSVVVTSDCGSATNSGSLTVAACFPALDVMMVIDRTGSMSGQAYTDARSAATNFVRNLRLGATNDQLGLVSYNPTAVLNQTMTTNGIAVEQAINSLGPATNGTCIACGITAGQAELESSRRRPDALPVMVLLSDGVPNDFDTPSNALYHALQAKYAGTRFFTIGLGAVDHDLMAGMASSTNDYFYTADSSGLAGLFDAISEIICRPPTNIFGPFNTTVCAGTNVTLDVSASGCASFAYQWRRDSSTLFGETNKSLSLTNVRGTNSGMYSVIVSGSCRTVTNSALVTVNEPALIVTPPANQFGYIASNVVFTVGATGTGLSYQWLFNGSVVGTGSTLQLNQLTASNAGTYCVTVSGSACGDPTSVCASLTLVNRAPFATNDAYTTDEDTPLTIVAPGVLVNDNDLDGDPLSVLMIDPPAHGVVTVNADGSFTYAPTQNFHGVDAFTYRANDGQASSDLAVVSITVNSVNDTPVAANDDHYITQEDTTLTVGSGAGVLFNDIDVDGDPLSTVLVSTTTNGTLALQANGAFAYLPNAHFHGVDQFAYRASDGTSTSAVAIVRITVTPVNDQPIAPNDSYTTDEDVALVITAPGVLANDSDIDGDTLSTLLVNTTTNGALALNGDGSFTYKPATNFHGLDSFTYRATDGQTSSSIATVIITVNSVNDTPVAANDDQYVTQEDTLLVITDTTGVLSNDIDIDGDVLTALLGNSTTNGTLTLQTNGAFSYLPNTNFHGVDHFTYRVTDGISTSDVAVVTISVLSNNDVPVARDDSYTTDEDVALLIGAPGVLGNDIDSDGDTLSTVLLATTTNGSLTLNANGSFTYRPATNFHGIDSFTYRASDGQTNSGIAIVTITINSINDTPVPANDDQYTTQEDILLTVAAGTGVLINDVDVDADTLSAVLVSATTNGTLTLQPNGSFVYLPNTNFHGIDHFTYRATDGIATSGVAVVTITVNSVNDTPVPANDDQYVTQEDTVLTVAPGAGILINDIDVDGDTLSAVLVNTTTNGSLALQPNGSFVYRPNTNFHGVDHFTYRATDGFATSVVAVVTINVLSVNDVPVARNDSYATGEDVVLSINAPGVLTNDSDADGDALNTVLVNTTTNGTLTLQPNGSFIYRPATNFHGIDSFTYRASDGLTNSGIAIVTITVNSINDTPVAAADDQYATIEDTLLTIAANRGVLTNDIDVDGDVLIALLVNTTTNGSLVLQPDGSFTYLPSTNFNGIDHFTYRATDSVATSGVAVVTITTLATNDAPIARDDAYSTDEDVPLVGSSPGVLVNDTDADGNVLTTSLVTTTTHGTLVLNANGSFTYAPATNFHGTDSYSYRARDLITNSSIAVVTITVNSINDKPVAANDDLYVTSEDTAITIPGATGVLANDIDVDGDVLRAILVSTTTNGTLTLQTNGSFGYVPNTNFHGVDHFTYRATDGTATSDVAVVTITVLSVNDVPVARDDSYTTDEDVVLVIAAPGVLTNDSDVDGDTLSTVLATTTTNGTLTLNANGSFTYRPTTNFHGADSFTYRASDGQTNSGIATVAITVRSVNDTPVAANDDQYVTQEDTLLSVPATAGVLANDLDVDGDVMTAVLANTTTNGALALQPNGSFVYLPNTNFHGVDHFTYRATDGQATSSVAVVTINVVSVNDVPVARDDSYATDEDVTLVISLPGILNNDSDQDGDVLTVLPVSTTTQGTLTLNPNGSFTYAPATNFHGTDVFTYRAGDGQTSSAVGTVTITVRSVNDQPHSRDDGGETYTVLEDQTLAIGAPGVLVNDSDEDGDVLTAALVTVTGHGALVLNANGSFTYTPIADYYGSDSFTYVARDASTSSAPSTVTIIVRPVNDAPSFVKGANQRVNFNSGPQAVANWATGIKAGPTNEGSQLLNFILSNNNSSLFSTQPAISPSGSLSYTPSGNNFGVATVNVTLKDGGGTTDGGVDASLQQTFAITLNGPPLVSIVSPTNGTTLIGTNNVTVVAEASDPDSVVTNVQIFFGTNVIGNFTNGPYFSFLSNLPPAIYSFYAVAADDLNLRATSGVISVTITASPPVNAVGPIALNRQNGLFEQYVRIHNPTPRSFPNGMRLFITIDTTNRVFNATGTNASGTAYIDVLQPLVSGAYLEVLVQYYVPDTRSVPNPILMAQPLPFTIPSTPPPNVSALLQSNGNFLLRFATATNRLYLIQSSSNLMQWATQPGVISGAGATTQWTNSPAAPHQFFRAVLLPY